MYRKIQQIPCSDPSGSANLRLFQPASQLISPIQCISSLRFHSTYWSPLSSYEQKRFSCTCCSDCIGLYCTSVRTIQYVWKKIYIVTFTFCMVSCLHNVNRITLKVVWSVSCLPWFLTYDPFPVHTGFLQTNHEEVKQTDMWLADWTVLVIMHHQNLRGENKRWWLTEGYEAFSCFQCVHFCFLVSTNNFL